jgi:hypothetical protein
VTTSAPRACEKEGNETQSQMSDETHRESVSRKISARSSDVVRDFALPIASASTRAF